MLDMGLSGVSGTPGVCVPPEPFGGHSVHAKGGTATQGPDVVNASEHGGDPPELVHAAFHK